MSAEPITCADCNELLDELEGMVRQHVHENAGQYDSLFTSANADAMRALAKYGRMEIADRGGRNVTGYFRGEMPR